MNEQQEKELAEFEMLASMAQRDEPIDWKGEYIRLHRYIASVQDANAELSQALTEAVQMASRDPFQMIRERVLEAGLCEANKFELSSVFGFKRFESVWIEGMFIRDEAAQTLNGTIAAVLKRREKEAAERAETVAVKPESEVAS